MNAFRKPFLRLCAISLALSLSCAAHETWLVPNFFTVMPDHEVIFNLTSGMKFPALAYAIKPERIAEAHLRQGGKIFDLGPGISAKTSQQFRHTFEATGLVTAWLKLHPKTLELSETKVTEYFAEISASAEIRQQWASLKATHQWRETYTKCAKTFLLVGEGAKVDASWQEPVGLPLEIVPLSDPTALHQGDHVSVELRNNGRLLAGATIGLIAADGGPRVFQQTDVQGRATFTLTHEGPALFFAVQLQWRETQWFSNFTTLDLRVAPAPGG